MKIICHKCEGPYEEGRLPRENARKSYVYGPFECAKCDYRGHFIKARKEFLASNYFKAWDRRRVSLHFYGK